MQRVLTFPTNLNGNHGGETVTKRLCCSILITTAFLSIVGGFLLGRYTTERGMLIRQMKVTADEEQQIEIIHKLINATYTFTVLASELKSQPPVVDKLFNMLQCNNFLLPDLDIFKQHLNGLKNNSVSFNLQMLTGCLNNASLYIRHEVMLDYKHL